MAAPIANAEHMRSSLFSFLTDSQSASSLNDTHLGTILKFSNELKLFSDEKANIQSWTGHVNQCLGASKSRLEGLGLLTVLVDQCSAAVFRQNCASWVRLLMQILQSHDAIPTMHVASNCLATILKVASNMAELSRDLATNHIPGVISSLMTLKPQLQLCSLQVLSACLNHFAGPCGPFKHRLELYLLSAMESTSSNISLGACKCYALLPKIGGGGTGGAKHTEAWDLYCDKLLHTGHDILEKLYQDVHREHYPSSSGETLKLTAAPEKEPDRTTCLVQQFVVICRCLQNLLQEEFPAPVNIPMEGILTLCCRTMAVTGKMLVQRLSMEMVLLSASLSALHSAAFDVLSTLIISCRNHLIPFGQVVNKLFIQSLAWTNSHQSASGKQSPYSNLRLKMYKCLQTWLEVVGASSGLESVAETLVEQVLLDAKPQVDVTKLSSSIGEDSKPTAVFGKKNKKSKHKGSIQELSVHSRVDLYANSDICAAALSVLRLMFLRFGMMLKPAIHKDVHEFAVPLLLQIQHQSHNAPPIPYSSGACREALYRLLLACVLVPHSQWPAPMHCAVRIFSVGRQDTSIQVASACAEASVICTNLLHPKVPSLHSSINLAEIKPKEKEVVHVMSTIPMMIPQPTPQEMEIEEDGRQILSKDDRQSDNESDIEQEAVVTDQQSPHDSGSGGSGDESEDEEEDNNENDQVISGKMGDDTETDITPEPTTNMESGESIRKQSRDEKSVIQRKDGGGDDVMSGDEETTGGKGKRKRDQEEGQSSTGKKKALAEEKPTEELTSMLSTFVDSFPDSD